MSARPPLKPRLLVDPETGETYEVGEESVIGTEPYDFAQAKRVAAKLSRERRAAERDLADRVKKHAAAEAAYRAELREQIVKDKSAHGSTAGLEMARGAKGVVDLREARDVAAGMVKAAEIKLRGCEGDRATFHRLVEWSTQRERMEQGVGG